VVLKFIFQIEHSFRLLGFLKTSMDERAFSDAPGSGGAAGERLILLFAEESVAGSLGPHFHDFSAVIWNKVDGTFVKSTIVTTSELCALEPLQQLPGVLITDEDSWIRGDPAGQVDFAPLRARGADGKWQVPERYKGYSFGSLKTLLTERLGAGRFAARSLWGRRAIRAVVPPATYGKVAALAAELGLEFRRVSPSPVGVALLTVKVIKGCVEELPFAVRAACEGVKAKYPDACFGRQTAGAGMVSVVVYITQPLTVKDHYDFVRDGVRTTLTSSFGDKEATKEVDKAADAVLAVIQKESDEQHAIAACEVLPELIGADRTGESGGDANRAMAVDVATANADAATANFRCQALDAEADGIRRTVKSWRILHLPSDVCVAAVTVIEALRTSADVDDIENRAAFLALCPTPATILDETVKTGRASGAVEHLRGTLQVAPKPPSTKMLSEAPGPNGAFGSQPRIRTFAQAARVGRDSRTRERGGKGAQRGR
jgi:hypothetical protein